ncbi:hypothetical protein FHS29_003726 [Saccharothrix tamanrassetensis]|uniref:Uncharacterized protein n=1 Tax=Saccharothrix tamanrassetensis TaxID=1051531 RepID=A0A841CJI4_9PSEU|nr:hypothetical protein [Saccharothrix tamanrassetensis]MBB5957133.1 hypothetical protein [Saccharothrix tamanrassetensis]
MLRSFHEEDGHLPEFGTLTVRDTRWDGSDVGLFGQDALRIQPCGTVARTGAGWLEVGAGDGPLTVRLELHEFEPPDTGGWHEVVDIPYRSLCGAVGLTLTTGAPMTDDLVLAGPGDYRLRVSGSPDRWLLRFWRAQVAPPRWLVRTRPAVRAGDPGWRRLFGHYATDLLFAVWAARDEQGWTSVEALARWGLRHRRGASWLDDPLPAPMYDELDPVTVAAELGAPAPRSLRGLLPLFAAAGMLDRDVPHHEVPNNSVPDHDVPHHEVPNDGVPDHDVPGDGDRFRTVADPPRAQDVLALPESRKAALDSNYEMDRFRSFATDLVSVALWGGQRQTLAALAERTLVPVDEVRATLDWAVRQGRLTVDGPVSGEFTMRPVGGP